MKRILITGAAGFLGSHLSDRFIKEGYEVIGMDNLITGDMDNIAHLLPLEHFSFHHHDVSNYVHVADNLDYILHFASPASPIDYLKMPIQTLKVGSLGTHNLLGLAKAKGARILIASTSEVYGDPLVNPQPEEYWGNVNPIGPRGVYDEAKRFQEAMTMAYHTYHSVEIRIARIFNTYGPNMDKNDGRVITNIITQAMSNMDITVYGDGLQTRSFCYIDDAIKQILKLSFSRKNYNSVFNIGNMNEEIQIFNLAREIKKIVNKQCNLIKYKITPGSPKRRVPNMRKTNSVTKIKKFINLKKGLLKTTEWYLNEKN